MHNSIKRIHTCLQYLGICDSIYLKGQTYCTAGPKLVLIPSHPDYGPPEKSCNYLPCLTFQQKCVCGSSPDLILEWYEVVHLKPRSGNHSQAPLVEKQVGRLLMEISSSVWEETSTSKVDLRSRSHCSSRSIYFHNNSAMFLSCRISVYLCFPKHRRQD